MEKDKIYLIYCCCFCYWYYYHTENPLRPSYYIVKVNVFPLQFILQLGKNTEFFDKVMLIMLLISFSSLKNMTAGNWSDLFVAGHCRLKCLDAWYPLQGSHNMLICPCSRVRFYRSLPLYFANPLCQNRISHRCTRCRPPPTHIEMFVCIFTHKYIKEINPQICVYADIYVHTLIYLYYFILFSEIKCLMKLNINFLSLSIICAYAWNLTSI